jgi:hypothetical protein
MSANYETPLAAKYQKWERQLRKSFGVCHALMLTVFGLGGANTSRQEFRGIHGLALE